MPLQLISSPEEEPVSLEEAKLHLRVDFVEDDALIAEMIAAARRHAEMLTQRQIITARWKWMLDGFPCQTIVLPKSPVQSVLTIEYLDLDGILQTMPVENYTVDVAGEPTRITPVFGQIWPLALPQIGSVSMTFDAGYGTASDVPEGIKSWIKIRLGSLYAHREEMAVLSRGRIDPLPFVDGLLDPYKVVLA